MQLTRSIPTILRPDLRDAALNLRARQVIPLIIVAGALYGGVMGSFTSHGPPRWLQVVYSALKVPLLLGVSFAVTLPCFFILNTLLGLRADFRSAIRTLVIAQAGISIVLASLSPFVALWYASCADYPSAILFNGIIFAIATVAGQILLRRFFRTLIEHHPRHRALLRTWVIVYAFIAIQMAWVLRPFVGGPSEATTFFRQGAWGNAYVQIADLIWHGL